MSVFGGGGVFGDMGERVRLTSLKPKVATLDTRVGGPVAKERTRGSKLMKTRERIGRRDCFTCQVCGQSTTKANGEVDHIVPLHLGGSDSDENRQWICREPCHRLKTEKEEKGRGA